MPDLRPNERQPLVRATLEIDAIGPAPGGSLTSAEGRQLAFSGWAELAAAIEDVRGGSPGASADPSNDENRSTSRQIGSR